MSEERVENQRNAVLIGVSRHDVKRSAGKSGCNGSSSLDAQEQRNKWREENEEDNGEVVNGDDDDDDDDNNDAANGDALVGEATDADPEALSRCSRSFSFFSSCCCILSLLCFIKCRNASITSPA